MQNQLNALLILGCLGYGLYLAWGLLVLLVTAPCGALTDALATAKIDEDEEEEDRQRLRHHRRRRYDDDELDRDYCWDDED